MPYNKAPILRRMLAYVLDVTLFLLPGVVALYLVLSPSMRAALVSALMFKHLDLDTLGISPSRAIEGTLPVRTILALVVATVALCGWQWYRVRTAMRGASIGKKLCGLTVVAFPCTIDSVRAGQADSCGTSLKQALRRLTPGLVLGMVPVPGTGFVGYLTALFDSNGRGLHDKAAGTMVVTTRQLLKHAQ